MGRGLGGAIEGWGGLGGEVPAPKGKCWLITGSPDRPLPFP